MKKLTVAAFVAMAVTLCACGEGNVLNEESSMLQTEQASEEAGTSLEAGESSADLETEKPAADLGTEESSTETKEQESTVSESEAADAYNEIISSYSAALSEQWTGQNLWDHDLNYMIADCYGEDPFENIGYAIKDIDGNGTAELLIGTTAKLTDEFYGKMIFDLYGLDGNGGTVQIFTSGERDRYYYAGSNLFVNQGSSGAADSIDTTLSLSNGALSDLGYATEASSYQQLELQPFERSQTDGGSGNDSSIQLPILDEIDQNTSAGTTGAYLTAVQSAVKLLDWGTATGLDPQEIKEATVAWLSEKGNDEQVVFSEKLTAVDDAYQKLLGEKADAMELLESAGCEDAAYPWSDAPVESIEAIMETVGLR